MNRDSKISTQPRVGVAVITHNAKHHLPYCLPPLLEGSIPTKVVVVNSSSNDGTVELAKEMGAETLVIPRKEFNHGTTREQARKYLNCDIVVMITPDAYAVNSELIEHLIRPLINNEASVSYARQIAHDQADIFESFPREFNYPSTSHIRGVEDVSQYGVYTYFCSNSCAAYNNVALDSVGGFPHLLLGEDTVTVAKLLAKGHRIAYVAEAIVKHSHRYSLKQEFMRYFDTGLARKEYEHLFLYSSSDQKRGLEYTKAFLKKLIEERPIAVPYGLAQTLSKWFGYQLGRQCISAPLWIKKLFSSQDFFWISQEKKF